MSEVRNQAHRAARPTGSLLDTRGGSRDLRRVVPTYRRVSRRVARPAVAQHLARGGPDGPERDALLAQLRADTVPAEGSFTNAKDFTRAIAKLDAAGAKLDSGKNADAAAKVDDFQASLNPLATAAKPTLDPAVAERLVAEA